MQDISVTLKVYDEATIRKLAVVSIRNASTTDHGTPKTAGLMDARMGSTDRSILCQTCNIPHCGGHFGMIEFPTPVLLPGHIKRILALLRCVCGNCVAPLTTDPKFMDIPSGMERIKAMSDFCRSKVSACPSCHSAVPAYVEHNRLFIKRTFTQDQLSSMPKEEVEFYKKQFTTEDIWSIIDKIPSSFLETLGISQTHPRNCIPKVLLVLPPPQRPTLRIADGGKSRGEDDLTVIYQDIVRAMLEYETKYSNDPLQVQVSTWNSFCKMQLMVACLVKHGLRKLVSIPGLADHQHRTTLRTMRDLEHRLKGKAGRLRGTLNAKRTDFSSRTVVGIDMHHDIWQLGVPDSRMKILTIPVRVTDTNMQEMQERIVRGSVAFNGANNILQPIEGKEDRMIFLGLMDEETRKNLAASLQVGWIVERHLQEGDWVWFNRQPTLHKMNIQAFQIYPIKGLTFRLPLPCTRPFNADFDGDEMNMHVPQSIEAVAEAQELMAVPFNMISPSNTSAIIALVQESLVAWFTLTSRNTLLSRDTFMQLQSQLTHNPHSSLYNSLQTTELLWSVPTPAILKSPKGPLWTGKQILQCLLPLSVHLTRAVRDGDISTYSAWMHEKEDIVVIRNGQLLLGRLCKSTLGGGPSLVHQLWKDIGPWASAKFVSDAQRIANAWNQIEPMCINIKDCIIGDESVKEVDDLVATAMGKADAVELTEFPREIKEMRVTSLMQDVLRSAGALCLKRMDPSSALATVVISGSKGNALNLSQIMAVVGQQTIGGKRVQCRQSRKGTRGLACFRPGDTRPEALGFVATSYMQGQTESEFVHAMMAGREGIVATAVETATSGYNQRKMVKIQEGQIIAYDRSVRIASKEVVTLHYGGDDYDSVHLERVKFSPILRMSNDAVRDIVSSDAEYAECILARDYLRTLTKPLVPGEYTQIVSLPFSPARITDQILAISSSSSLPMTPEYCMRWISSTCKAIQALHSGKKSCMKTVSAIRLSWPSTFFLHNAISVEQAKALKQSLVSKTQKALVSPGEAVGTIGSTSIGEPSTQGALNTFHFSGIAEKSGVTGVKRFKELIGCAKCKETCVVNILFDEHEVQEAQELYKKLKGVLLGSLLSYSKVVRASDAIPLQKQEEFVLPWVHSWMNPLSKIDFSKQVHLALQRPRHNDSEDYAIHICLDKRACMVDFVTPSIIVNRVRAALKDTCLVLSSQEFEDPWCIRIRPFAVDTFMVNSVFNSRAVCDSILDILSSNCYVKGLPIVTDAFHVASKVDVVLPNGGLGKQIFQKVGTVGSDLLAMAWMSPKPHLLWSNDIQDTYSLLGIEAATLLNNAELQRVLCFDSTVVDPRHTQLLGETMGRTGIIAPLNRHKMEELGSSLLSRASFEQTLPVLEDAAFFRKSDSLSGSLERQIVGLPLRVGTGIVGIKEQHSVTKEATSVLAPLQKPWKANQMLAPLESVKQFNCLLPLSYSSTTWTPHVSSPLSASASLFASVLLPVAHTWVQALQEGDKATLRISHTCYTTDFERRIKQLESYQGWDNPDDCTLWYQSKEILWDNNSIQVSTIVNLGEAKARKIHILKNKETSKASLQGIQLVIGVHLYRNVQGSSVSDNVVPTCVHIRQRRSFLKDGWKYCFTKFWKAATNLEAEAAVLTQQPTLTFTLDACTSQASTNASLHIHEAAAEKMLSLL